MKSFYTALSLSLFAALSLADASDFPSFDLLHNKCAVQVTLPGALCG